MQLYKCTNDIQMALNHHFDSESEQQDTLEAVIGQFEIKAQSVIAYTLNQSKEIELLEAHIKTMQDRLKTLKSAQNSLQEYLKINMQRAGIQEIRANDGTFTAKIVKNPDSVDVYDMTLLDPAYIREKITYEPNKTAIKEALKNGENIQGAKLKTNQTRVQIR